MNIDEQIAILHDKSQSLEKRMTAMQHVHNHQKDLAKRASALIGILIDPEGDDDELRHFASLWLALVHPDKVIYLLAEMLQDTYAAVDERRWGDASHGLS